MTQNQELQRLCRLYKDETGNSEVNPREYAQWLNGRGWELPEPQDPLELLAKKVQVALREETRRDATTGLPYKVNLSFSLENGQGSLYIDVDEAKRNIVLKCLIQRREQTVGDVFQMELIKDHWNSTHPAEEPIQLPLDYQPDVEWKKNGPDSAAA
jgi:hypothetical protein